MMVMLGDLTTASGTPFSSFHVFVTESLGNNDVFEANGGGRINPGTSVNNSGAAVTYLEIGSRNDADDGFYSDLDMQILKRARGGEFTRKDGSPL